MSHPTTDEMIVVETPWYYYVILGVIFVFLGVAGLGMLYALTLYTIFVGGFLLIAGGAGQVIIGIFAKRGSSVLMNLAVGLLYLMAGVFAVSNPDQAAIVLTWLLSVALIITGIARLVLAFLHRRLLAWLTMVISGFIAILLGVYILNRWPWDSDWVIGLFFAVDLLFQGISYLALGLHLKVAAGR
jgi:uncharacterized membrane protein HdeD (DUF308 family)